MWYKEVRSISEQSCSTSVGSQLKVRQKPFTASLTRGSSIGGIRQNFSCCFESNHDVVNGESCAYGVPSSSSFDRKPLVMPDATLPFLWSEWSVISVPRNLMKYVACQYIHTNRQWLLGTVRPDNGPRIAEAGVDNKVLLFFLIVTSSRCAS